MMLLKKEEIINYLISFIDVEEEMGHGDEVIENCAKEAYAKYFFLLDEKGLLEYYEDDGGYINVIADPDEQEYYRDVVIDRVIKDNLYEDSLWRWLSNASGKDIAWYLRCHRKIDVQNNVEMLGFISSIVYFYISGVINRADLEALREDCYFIDKFRVVN